MMVMVKLAPLDQGDPNPYPRAQLQISGDVRPEFFFWGWELLLYQVKTLTHLHPCYLSSFFKKQFSNNFLLAKKGNCRVKQEFWLTIFRLPEERHWETHKVLNYAQNSLNREQTLGK